jgi:hypothetical protein
MQKEFSEVVTPVGEGEMPTKKRGKRQKKKSHLDAGEGILANFGLSLSLSVSLSLSFSLSIYAYTYLSVYSSIHR